MVRLLIRRLVRIVVPFFEGSNDELSLLDVGSASSRSPSCVSKDHPHDEHVT
jgi:hypothetical protein